METIILLAIAILPVIVIGFIIYKKDIIEKEPIGLLISLFVMGIFSVIPAAFIESITLGIIDKAIPQENVIYAFITAFFGVAVVEEGVKYILSYVRTYNNKSFNQLYDGIVYCVFLSLGFAAAENIMYVIEGGAAVAILRAICSVPGHAFFAVTMGYYMGISKFYSIRNNDKLKNKYMILSLLLPIIEHGIFDFLLLTENAILIIVFFVFVIVLYIIGIKLIKKQAKIMSLL